MPDSPLTLAGRSGAVTVTRDAHGIPHIHAADLIDAHLGLGYCHARDRGMQMLLVRTLARGQACEKLRDTDDLLDLDKFFRRLNLGSGVEDDIAGFSPAARAGVEAYAAGVNLYFQSHRLPWELRLLSFSIENDPWTAADIIITGKTIGYVGMGQAQAELERFIVECVQAGLSRDKLEELFPRQLGGLDESLLRQVKLEESIIPAALWTEPALPRVTASNNWVLSGAKTISGHPILCNDPHLDIDRIPPVWYEAALRWGGDEYAIGATMPGCPGIILGRTRHVAWGVTYAFMDCVDSWIERCDGGQYLVGNQYCNFSIRKEIIRRKKHDPLLLTFYDNHHGTLEGDPHVAGLYLATRWSCGQGAGAESINAIFDVLQAQNTDQALAHLGHVNNSSWNWIAADMAGNIGYQMSGKMPLRPAGTTGLVPLPGWDSGNDWGGFAAIEDLPRQFNPPEGFIATANEDLNHLGRLKPINACTGPYRAERIREVLSEDRRFSIEDMKGLQLDVHSLQADRFVAKLGSGRDAMAHNGSHLRNWDFEYRTDAVAPTVFEAFYLGLLNETFGGAGGFGALVWRHVLAHTAVFVNYFGNFDRILLSEDSVWFAGQTRAQLYERVREKSPRSCLAHTGTAEKSSSATSSWVESFRDSWAWIAAPSPFPVLAPPFIKDRSSATDPAPTPLARPCDLLPIWVRTQCRPAFPAA